MRFAFHNHDRPAGAAWRQLAVVAAVIGLGSAAHATPVTWTLEGVTFDDGATATGSFVFDADTGVYSGIDITTAGGSVLPGATYTAYDIGSTPRDSGFGANELGFTAAGDFLLDINGLSSFTDAGGTVTIGNPTGFTSAEGACVEDGCTMFFIDRDIVSGTLSGSATPEPASWALMLVGFGGLGAVLRSRRARVAPAAA